MLIGKLETPTYISIKVNQFEFKKLDHFKFIITRIFGKSI